jgi:hypothetical protein
MDEETIKAEARDYVEQAVRNGQQDLESVPAQALERAIKAATASAKDLHEAARLAREANS